MLFGTPKIDSRKSTKKKLLLVVWHRTFQGPDIRHFYKLYGKSCVILNVQFNIGFYRRKVSDVWTPKCPMQNHKVVKIGLSLQDLSDIF